MDDREFVIPRDRDELQVFTENQYSIRDVFSVDQITDQYLNCRSDLETEGIDFIVERFELMYSSLVHFPNVPKHVIHELWDVSLDGLRCLVSTLAPLLEEDEEIEEQVQAALLFKAKMLFYIFSELMVRCEEKQLQDKASALPQKGRRKPTEKDSDWNWNHQKNLALTELYKFVNLPLKRLWRPANMSEDFLDQMSKCCLKLLEDREIGFVNNKPMRDSIFQILSILCKEYIFGLSLMPKIIQLLMLYEHLAAPLAQSVAQLEEHEGNVGMMKLALQELNGEMEYMAKSGHNCGQFLLELGKSNPKGVCKHLPLITDHLTREPYNVRMGVIELVGHLLLKVYNEEDLTEQQKEEKETLFECLFDHLSDLTAFCRSRTLQVWKELCEEEAIPKATLLIAIEKIIPCILDKSSTTRKDAIKLMKAFLEHNPFAARLHTTEINDQITKAVEHLKSMEQKAGISSDNDLELFWNENSEDIAKAVHEVLSEEARKKLAGESEEKAKDKETEEKDKMEEEDDEDAENTMVEEEKEVDPGAAMLKQLLSVADLLRAKKYPEAVHDGIKLVKQFDTKNVLGVAASQGASQREREAFLSDLEDDEDDEEDEEEFDTQEKLLQHKIQKKVRVVHRLMHMACLAQQQQLTNDAPEITEQMKEELKKQVEFVAYLKECLKFSELVHCAVEKVLQVLDVSQTTDLAEAIDFIASAQQFGLLTEETGMTRLLCFVHSKDLSLKSTVTAAYKKIYLYAMNREGQECTHEDVIEAMKKVCDLIHQSPAVYERSLKVLVQSWVTGEDINKECIDVLWGMVSGNKKDECIAAMNILHMVLESDPRNVQEHLHYLEKFGFGKRGSECFELAKNTCKVLTVVSPKLKSESDEDPYKLAGDEEVLRQLSEIIVTGMFKTNDKAYCDMVAAAMVAIFKVCDHPADFMAKILNQICTAMEEHCNQDVDKTVTEEPMEGEEETQASQASQISGPNTQASSKTEDLEKSFVDISQEVLMRFMEVLSCSMNQLLVFLMNEVLVEMRRHRYLAEKDKEQKQVRQSRVYNDDDHESDSSLCSISSVIQILPSLTEEEALDRITHITNLEVLDNYNVLGKFLPMIEEICQKPNIYTHYGLQICAVQALSRAMMLSQQYCNSKIRLFCTLMVKSTDYRVRIAAIHALADLLRRFPNEVDPYSPNLYKCLKDDNVVVRREVLVVLSKLILGDMLRVKFQISYLAACLTDSDQSCKDIASYFFATLATKGNILYNLVLDMISQLSSEESEKNQKEFETIMRVILPYIDKERQVVALVEKLCSRFPEKTTEQECHNIALCVSILPVSQKSVRALKDNFNFFADKVKYVTVKIIFDGILQTARKQFKGENKEFLEEFQENLDKCSDKEAVKEAIAQMAITNNKEKAAKPVRAPAKKGRAKKVADSSDDSDDAVSVRSNKTGKSGARGRKAAPVSESEDSDTETTNSIRSGRAAPASTRKPQRGGAKRAKPANSESDSDSAFEEAPTPSRRIKTPAHSTKTQARSAKTPAGKRKPKGDKEETDGGAERRSGRTRSSIRL